MPSQAGNSPMAQEVLALSESGARVRGFFLTAWLLSSHFPPSPLSLSDTSAGPCFHIDFPHSGLV